MSLHPWWLNDSAAKISDGGGAVNSMKPRDGIMGMASILHYIFERTLFLILGQLMLILIWRPSPIMHIHVILPQIVKELSCRGNSIVLCCRLVASDQNTLLVVTLGLVSFWYRFNMGILASDRYLIDINSGYSICVCYYIPLSSRMAWQWAKTLVEIRGTLADIRGTTKLGADGIFPNMNLTGLYV